MKKHLLLFLFLFILSQTEAQITFCPPGAKWNYSFQQYWMGILDHNYAVNYIGDSIVAGDTLKILQYNSFFRYSTLQQQPYIAFIKQRGDTIFIRNYWTNHQWQILYNFAAQPGQS